MTVPPSISSAVLTQGLRQDFPLFLGKAASTLNPGDPFLPNWHLDAIAHRLDGVGRHGGARLMVNMPPRSLKSITISVAWVAYLLGRNPSLRFICVSYSQELAAKLARDCRTLMQTDWYKRAFPKTVLARIAENDLRTTAGGGRYSTSVGGTLTGLGGDIIIIDDPIKPDEAPSETARRNLREWYSDALISRLDSKVRGSIVLVMQRVHQDDLSGHLFEAGGWDHLCLPAIATRDEDIPIGGGRIHRRRIGDVLHPEREPLKVLDEMRATMRATSFAAQYQQAPVPAEGNTIKAKWLQRYEGPLARAEGDLVVQSWDCANKAGPNNDWSVCVTSVLRGNRVYVVDVFRDRVDFPDLRKKAIALAREHQVGALLIEDAASGQQLLQCLRKEEPVGVPRPIGRTAVANKEVRMDRPSAEIEAGRLFLPVSASWLVEFETELLGFPYARHDDIVDALAQLMNWGGDRLRSRTPAAPLIVTVNPDSPVVDDEEVDEFGWRIVNF